MMTDTNAVSVLVSTVALAGLWLYFVKIIPGLVIENYRNELFDLRTRFFDEALAGNMPFEHPGYGFFRSLVNGHIRFAHRASFAQVVIARSVYPEDSPEAREFEELWESVLSESTPEQQEILRCFRDELSNLTISRLVLGSWPIVLLVVPAALFILFKRAIVDKTARFLDPFNSIAFEEGIEYQCRHAV